MPLRTRWSLAGSLTLVIACGAPEQNDVGDVDASVSVSPDAAQVDAPPPRVPILFVHGVNGSADNFAAMRARFEARGWPTTALMARTFDDPAWGCNVDNADAIAAWANELRTATGAQEIDVVAHSMGTLSSRHFIKNLGGATHARTYATLGGMHHGLSTSCSPSFPGKPCIWSEICSSGDMVEQLNAVPATPGPTRWISIYGSADDTIPNSSSMLAGAENILVTGADHMGLLEEQATFDVLAPLLQ